MAEVYFILGAEGAGRREIVRDLIEGDFDDDETVFVAMHESEPATPADEQLAARAQNRITRYNELASLQPPTEARAIFIIASGRTNPLDSVEAFKDWLEYAGHELARIITVVHCQLVYRHAKLAQWYRACIHFSDVVLLNRRQDIPNKWFADFREPYDQERFPCLFELVKKGRVTNPALILEPQPRRLSLAFDDDLEPVDLMEFDENNLPDETVDLVRPIDPWLKRLPSGYWENTLPNISDLLE
ncbi:MAG: GTP-binding protein [Puniceicoccales bacterium]